MAEETFITQRLDHLGIVAGICEKIDLIKQIDTCVGATERKVSVGEAVQSMVLNALGFVGRPLYLTPEFFSNKPVDLLIRDDLTAEDFNDDSLGRALDILYETGVTEVFAYTASHALDVFEIEHRFVHLDSTTFSLEGEYLKSSEEPQAIQITHGYSRDHRPDLKQVVVSLICTDLCLVGMKLAQAVINLRFLFGWKHWTVIERTKKVSQRLSRLILLRCKRALLRILSLIVRCTVQII